QDERRSPPSEPSERAKRASVGEGRVSPRGYPGEGGSRGGAPRIFRDPQILSSSEGGAFLRSGLSALARRLRKNKNPPASIGSRRTNFAGRRCCAAQHELPYACRAAQRLLPNASLILLRRTQDAGRKTQGPEP